MFPFYDTFIIISLPLSLSPPLHILPSTLSLKIKGKLDDPYVRIINNKK